MVTSLAPGDILAAWTATDDELAMIEDLLRAMSEARPKIAPEELAAVLRARRATIGRLLDEVCHRAPRPKRDRSAYMRAYRRRRKGGGDAG